MAKVKISDYSATPASNTDIDNIDINEGCSPSGINNAIRSLMSHLKNWQGGTSGDTLPVASGGTGASTAATARTALGVSATGADTSYPLKTNNLSDLSNVATARGNLSAAKSGANSDITSLTGLTTALSVAQGGTGSSTLTANNSVLIANAAPIAPDANGNVLTSTAGSTVTAGSFVVGTQYTIVSVGTTSFTAIGASANTVGVVFTATGVGSGTGTASVNIWASGKQTITSGTVVASTSGTSIDFTSIPSWVKRITVMFNAVSTNGSSPIQIQLGAGSIITSGYNSQVSVVNTGAGTLNSTSGLLIVNGSQAAANYYGNAIITNITGNVWTETSLIAQPNGTASVHLAGGSISLAGTLDRIRITTVNGTDIFDAGSINIMYE